MNFIVALPNTKYYMWQLLVQVNNFKRLNYHNDLIYIIGLVENGIPKQQLDNIFEDLDIKYYIYDDTRVDKEYASSLRPHILKKHFKKYPNRYENFLYLDPDVLFTKKINFGIYDRNDSWYVSDTRSYISSKYIKGKSNELFEKMCNIVDINPKIVEDYDDNAGGAQYYMKNVSWEFWEKVEKDSEKLYILMKSTENIYSSKHPIQSWTADMWAVLWNAWYFKNDVKIAKGLDFAWGTDLIEVADNKSILHMAGLFPDNRYFNKINFSNETTPFNCDLNKEDNKKYVVYKYIEEIEDTKINYQHLLF